MTDMTPNQAQDVVRRSLLRIVPDADLGSFGPDDDLRDALELDSLDFLGFVESLSEQSGRRIDEEDYPRLRSLHSTVDFLAAAG